MKHKSSEKEKKKKRGERKTSMILEIPESESDAKGFAVEKLGLKIAKYWKKKKVIKDVKGSLRFSSDDLAKRDLTITHLFGGKLFFDLKSSWNEQKAKACQNLGVTLLPLGPRENEKYGRERMLAFIISDLMSNLRMEEIREVVSFINTKIEEKERIKPQPSLIKRILKKFFGGDK